MGVKTKTLEEQRAAKSNTCRKRVERLQEKLTYLEGMATPRNAAQRRKLKIDIHRAMLDIEGWANGEYDQKLVTAQLRSLERAEAQLSHTSTEITAERQLPMLRRPLLKKLREHEIELEHLLYDGGVLSFYPNGDETETPIEVLAHVGWEGDQSKAFREFGDTTVLTEQTQEAAISA